MIGHRHPYAGAARELARRAGIRPESLNRIEQGRVAPSVRTVEKIDRALKEAEADAK